MPKLALQSNESSGVRYCYIRSALVALLITLSLTINFAAENFFLAWSNTGILDACLFLLLRGFVLQIETPPVNRGGIVLSFASVFGEILRICGGFQFFGSNTAAILALLLTLTGRYFFFTYVLKILNFLFNKLDDISAETSFSVFNCANIKLLFLFAFLLLLMWSPCLISMFPGDVDVDYIYMISQGLGNEAITTHHPLFMTLIFTFLYRIGSAFGGIGSIAVTMLFQTLVMASAFAITLIWIKRITNSDLAILLALLAWGLVPEVSIYAHWLCKDTLSAALLFCSLLQVTVRLYCNQSKLDIPRGASLPALCIVGIIASLTRNDVVFIIAAAFIAVLIVSKNKGRVAIATIILVIGYFGINSALTVALNAGKGSIAEALSLPMMQTARTLIKHPDDVTPKEEEVLRELFGDDCYDNMAERYNPIVTDNVKNSTKGSIAASNSILMKYFKVWAAQGIRHPITYLESFLLSGVGYWSVSYESTVNSVHLLDTLRHDWGYDSFGQTHNWNLILSETDNEPFPALRSVYRWFIDKLQAMPILKVTFCPALYVIIDGLLLVRIKQKGSYTYLLFIPMLILLLTRIASPLNGSMRYAIPFVFVLPLLLGLSFGENKQGAKHLGAAK